MRVLVTGGTGFVGRVLVQKLLDEGAMVRVALRHPGSGGGLPQAVEKVVVGELGPATPWSTALSDIEVVIHCAGRAHILSETATSPEAAFQYVNVDATISLARTARDAGVRRMVFVSSANVHGARSDVVPFNEEQRPRPANIYARSKVHAEEGLARVALETGLDVVIVRPPIVYGPEVKANFLRLLRLVWSGLPLPLASAANKRSLVSVRNVADFLWMCTTRPAAAGQTFLLSDGEDISTSELVRRLGEGMGKRTRLFPMSPGLLFATADLVGFGNSLRQLCNPLQIDMTKARNRLGWEPPFTLGNELRRTARWYRQLREAR